MQKGFGGGVGIGGAIGKTDSTSGKVNNMARAFLRYGLVDHVQADFGIGITEVGNDFYKTTLIPFDLRLMLSPFTSDDINPYFYGGIGLVHFDQKNYPVSPSPAPKLYGWTGFAPAGIGVQLKMNNNLLFETSAGYNYTFTDDLDAVRADGNDAYWNFLIGVTATGGESDLADPDKDGLTNKEEQQLGTDPHNADTDGDGLSDGDEVNKYHTNPLNADSDGDGISDKDEVMQHHTDPNKADTDGDGLSDGDEVMKYKTNPLKADTDDDGLSDGDEVGKSKTDPLKADTDGDGLKDGDEVNRYHSDPLKADTDNGSVNDGLEITNGTDPLNPNDDVKKEELKTEVGKAVILDGVVFTSGSAELTSASEEILTKAYNTLSQNPEIEVQIQGHTDNVGKKSSNMKLSLQRADAVKSYLVNKGILASRISTKGFGPDKPVISNKTADGRQKNRRIEFYRMK
jgi:outer membrane protein OmpA-like peptidoglycan-associated protein